MRKEECEGRSEGGQRSDTEMLPQITSEVTNLTLFICNMYVCMYIYKRANVPVPLRTCINGIEDEGEEECGEEESGPHLPLLSLAAVQSSVGPPSKVKTI